MPSSPKDGQTSGTGGTWKALTALTVAQALGLSGAPLVVLAGGIAGAELAPVESLASLPLATMVVGTALGAAPGTLLVRRVGWRAGLVTGALVGGAGAALAAAAVTWGSFAVLALATLLVGASLASVMQYRFLAAALAERGALAVVRSVGPERAVAMVLSGGAVAGLVGPELGRVGQGLMPTPWVGSFLALAVVYALLALLLSVSLRSGSGPLADGVDRAESTPGSTAGGPTNGRPGLVVAMAAGVTAYAVMTLLMTATPFAMRGAGFDVDAIARVIQGHVVAMYAPSIVAGALIARFGAGRLMAGGLTSMATCVLLGLSSHDLGAWVAQLVLLGLGWNALFLGGTVVLADSLRRERGPEVQAVNESLVFGAQALASIAAGALVAFGGWRTVNFVALGPLALMTVILLGSGIRRMARIPSPGYAPTHLQGGQPGGHHASHHHPRPRPGGPRSLRSGG